MVKRSDESTAFLWADHIVKSEAVDGGEYHVDKGVEAGEGGEGGKGERRDSECRDSECRDSEEGEGEDVEGNGRAHTILDRQWTSDRMRRIMPQQANGCRAHGWGSAHGGRWRSGFPTGI